MTKKTSRNRRFIMTKNLIMMLVVLVVGLMAVWSWFTINRTVTARNIYIKSSYPNEIGLAEVRRDANGNDIGPDLFGGEISFTGVSLTKDCTGDGEALIVPDFSVIKDKDTATREGRVVNIGGIWEEALSQVDEQKILNNNPEANVEARYAEYEFYARSQSKNVTLDGASYLKASNENLDSGYTAAKKSAYGTFSSDSVVGAVRVALLARGAYVTQTYSSGSVTGSTVSWTNSNSQTNQRHLTCLWLPRPDIKLNVTNTGLTTDWTVSRNITNASGDTYVHKYFKPVNTDVSTKDYIGKYDSSLTTTETISKKKGVVVEEKTAGNTEKFVVTTAGSVSAHSGTYPTLGTTVNVSDVSESDYLRTSTLREKANVSTSNTSYYVFKYTLRIWLEGTDTESRRAMDGGQYKLHLEFR